MNLKLLLAIVVIVIIIIGVCLYIFRRKDHSLDLRSPAIIYNPSVNEIRDAIQTRNPLLIEIPNLNERINNYSVYDLETHFQGLPARLIVTKSGLVGWYFPDVVPEKTPDNMRRDFLYTNKPGIEVPAIQLDKMKDAFSYYKGEMPFVWDEDERYYVRISLPNKSKNLWDTPEFLQPFKHRETFYISKKDVITNLHYDNRPGFLVQLRGKKRVILFPEKDLKNVCMNHPKHPLERRSKMNRKITDENIDKLCPEMKGLKGYEVILEPNQALFIPDRCPHYVETLEDDTISIVCRLME